MSYNTKWRAGRVIAGSGGGVAA